MTSIVNELSHLFMLIGFNHIIMSIHNLVHNRFIDYVNGMKAIAVQFIITSSQ